jgi:raffinose/stachyose/melibiose transport system substrate-binding protein
MLHLEHRRVIAATALALTGALTVAGCAPTQGADADTTLSFFSWDNEETMTPIIDAFEAANPGITIEFSSAPPVLEYISTLQTRLLAGTAADVFILAAENKTNVIEGGFALDLGDETFMEPIADFNRDTYSGADGVFGMSVASWGGGVVVNDALLEAAGYTEFPSDWDGFLELAAALKASGVEPYYDNFQEIPMMLNALVGDQYDGDASVDAAIFAGETSFEAEWTPALETLNELFTEGLVSTDVVGLGGEQLLAEFIDGRVAMLATGPWNVGAIRSGAPDMSFSFHPFPSPDGSGVLPGAASPGYAINAATENVDAAKKFLAFLSSPEGVELYNAATSAITTTANFEPVIDDSLTGIVEPVRAGDVYLAQISWPRAQDVLSAEAVARLQQMILGQQTPADVARALDAKLAETE